MADFSYSQAAYFMAKLFRGYTDLNLSEQLKRLMFFYFSCLMASGAILWGVICLVYGYVLPSIIPFTYVAATGLNFILCSQSKENSIGCGIQVFISIALPFLFQYALGGLVTSGMVIVWSLLALLGSMTFQAKKRCSLGPVYL